MLADKERMLQAAQPHLKLSDAAVGVLAGVHGAAVLRYDLPLERAGQISSRPQEADHRPCNLRVRILEAEGLPTRPDGTPCQPRITVTVAELTRRRTRRATPSGTGPSVSVNESFDFEETSACAQVVVDVWDEAADGSRSDLLGKAVISLSDCREGVPHTFAKNMLEGKLVRRGCHTALPHASKPQEATPRPTSRSHAPPPHSLHLLAPTAAPLTPPHTLPCSRGNSRSSCTTVVCNIHYCTFPPPASSHTPLLTNSSLRAACR